MSAVIAMMVGLAVPASADPKNVGGTLDESGVEIDCGTEKILRDRQGWFGLIQKVDHVTQFHIRITYTNQDGDTWRYQDTGQVRFYEVDGEAHESLSGHSTNVGPGNTGWYGHWVFNIDQNTVVSLVGAAQGDIDQAACDALTG